MRALTLLAAAMLASCASPAVDEEAIIAEAEAADLAAMRAQNAGDLAAFAHFLSDDYAYIDLSGNRVGKAQILARRAEDRRTVIESSDSEDEAILLSPTVVMFRGRTDGVSSYYGGLPRPSSVRYSVVWRKEADGAWRMIAAQTTDRISREYPVKARIDLSPEQFAAFEGDWRLDTPEPLVISFSAVADRLLARIDGQFENIAFFADGPASFFALERPFELRFSEDASTLTLVTWGRETAGMRLAQ